MKRVILALGFLAAIGGAASAQEEEKRHGGGRVIKLEATVVEGHVHKPQAFYLLQRSNLDYDWENLRQEFLPKILQATGKHPF
jgi:hypothetical protein